MTAKILLFGKNGQVGHALCQWLPVCGELVATDRSHVDLTQPGSIRAAIREARPNWIVNAAAYTAVDRAESEPELAQAINGDALRIMGEEAAKITAAVVHYSTDYVFDGTKKTPYVESDATRPINVYGKTKLAGEQALQASGMPFLIFRTSWVYGTQGKNFLLTVLKLASAKEELRIVNDQVRRPYLERSDRRGHLLVSSANSTRSDSGNVHLPKLPPESITSPPLARQVGSVSPKQFSRNALIRPNSVAGIPKPPSGAASECQAARAHRSRLEFPTPARRPANSVLSNAKVQSVLWLSICRTGALQLRLAIRAVARATPSVDTTG